MNSHASAVDVATDYGLRDRGFTVRASVGLIILYSPYGPGRPYPHWSSNPIGKGEGVKWQGHEADYSPPTSFEVKKIRIYAYTYTPPYASTA
jgi:hypothetical protein